MVSATATQTITILAPLSLSSAGNQTFLIGDNPTNMSIITVTEDGSPSITAANDIRIRIPAGLNMLWDTGKTNATIGGGAASKVSSTVSYEDGGKTAVIAVNTDFAAGDQITIDKLRFTSFTALSSATSLELIVGGAGGPVAASDDKTKTVNDAPLKLVSGGQKFYVGQPPVAIKLMTITDATAAPTITDANDLRIRIPATFNMSWDTSDLTATIGGAAASKVSSSVSYEDGGKTLVLSVLTDFLAGDEITVLDLSFASFTAVSAKDRLELEVNNDGVVSAEDTKDKEILVGPSLSSAANQIFNVGGPATLADTITITESSTIKIIKAGKEIRIRIPAGFNMIWDATVTSVTIGGGAASKVSTTLKAYEDGGKTAVVDVTNDFVQNDQITVVGLKFTSFSAVSPPDSLELEVTDDGMVIGLDDKTIEIVDVTYGVAVTPDTTTASRLPSNGTNYTVDFTVKNNGSGSDDYDLLTTQNPGTAITVVSITGTGVTQGANPDSARVANVAAADSAVVTVTYSVADVAAGTTDTLVFTARSVGDPATTDDGRLELTVIRPNMTTAKAVSPSGTQPPGTDLTYTLTVTNEGSDSAAAVVIADSLPPEVQFKVGSVVNNLPAGVTVTVEYSNDAGSTWTYTPVSGGCTAPTDYDACVTHVRWTLQNNLTSIPPNNTGDVQFVAQIE